MTLNKNNPDSRLCKTSSIKFAGKGTRGCIVCKQLKGVTSDLQYHGVKSCHWKTVWGDSILNDLAASVHHPRGSREKVEQEPTLHACVVKMPAACRGYLKKELAFSTSRSNEA
eukprot:5402663-Amphidinium_carterae.1